MKYKDNNSPAFPVPQQSFGNGIVLECKHEGMTLRDWFAGMALQGLLVGYSENQMMMRDACRRALEAADTMLAFRERKEDA